MITENKGNMDDEMSIKDILTKIIFVLHYLKSQWWKILIIAIIGTVLGYVYAYIQAGKYKASLSFVVEESKGASGGLSSLAGQFGFDVGANNNMSVLSGDNILMFLKSRSLIKETLLTAYDSVQKNSLADKYAEVYELKEKWVNKKNIGSKIYFPSDSKIPFSRLQDSLLQSMVSTILNYELQVERPEKKASFISVQVNMKEETLCSLFCERLVDEATERYIQSKTKKQKANVARLEKRVDSIGRALYGKTYASALEQEKILDVNPGSRTATVNAEIFGRDKMMLGSIYGEVVKNLEIAKFQLTQETPAIQIVDFPEKPLKFEKKSKLISGIISGLLLSTLFAFFLICSLFFKKYKL